jgi:hypothetical protein
LKINFNIILQCMPRSSKRSLSFRHPHKNPGRTSSPSNMPYAPTWFILLDLTTRIVFVDKYNYEAPNYAVSSTCLLTHSLRPKYLPQRPNQHPHPTSFPQCDRPNFSPTLAFRFQFSLNLATNVILVF